LKTLKERLEIIGPVPRSAVAEHYRWADVFVFPSLCEGSATVCYEALAWGLPVITTPNSGSVVVEGTDGFIVPIRDPHAIAEKLEILAQRPALLQALSEGARRRAADYSIQRYRDRLVRALSEGYASWSANR